jgi:integrase
MPARRALTASLVASLKDEGVHWIGPSLYLQIRPQGTRSWLFRYTRNGENQWMGLGALADKPLSEARDESAMLRVSVRRGADPMAEKQAKREARRPKREVPTFAECAEQYIESHRAGWKNDKHIAQWESTIRMYANPVLGKMAVDQISVEDVLKVLQPIWVEKPETASRLRGRIEKVLGWATAMKFRSGDNPATWKGALSHLLPAISKIQTIEHHKAVPYEQVPLLMRDLVRTESMSAKALIFTILTAARTGETIGATWGEVDFGLNLWVVPASRMKAGREHRVPLSAPAVQLLEALPRNGEYVFTGSKPTKPLSNMAMLELLRGLRGQGETIHGFRSAFSTWARERTDYPREIVEASLAHMSGDAVELAYRRTDFLDKRRELMDAWAKFCMALI